MTKYLKIAILFLVLFVIYAPSCVDDQAIADREEAALNETRNEIRAEFEVNYLSEESLFAYETAAKQKLSDFVDYLQIISDTTLDKSFRKKAGEMIQNTFLSEEETLQLAPQKDDLSGEISVRNLIKQGLKNKLSLPPFSIELIVVDELFQRNGNATYSGTMKFLQIFTGPSLSPGESLNTIDRSADVYIIKDEKIFGADTLRVWSVRLGEIR